MLWIVNNTYTNVYIFFTVSDKIETNISTFIEALWTKSELFSEENERLIAVTDAKINLIAR